MPKALIAACGVRARLSTLLHDLLWRAVRDARSRIGVGYLTRRRA